MPSITMCRALVTFGLVLLNYPLVTSQLWLTLKQDNASSANEPDHILEHWLKFKESNGKNYDPREDYMRMLLFLLTESIINITNSHQHQPYTIGHNKFSDMTDRERQRSLGAFPKPPRPLSGPVGPSNGISNETDHHQRIPTSFDWRNSSQCIGPIKDQGLCGSCWAFAAITPIEFQQCQKSGQYISLRGRGCNGGDLEYAFSYLTVAGSISASAYPYVSYSGRGNQMCWYFFFFNSIKAKLKSYTYIGGNVESMMDSLVNQGPISACLFVRLSFQLYKSGVYNDAACDGQPYSNHCVVIVGYGTDPVTQLDYWILRNSWGKSWGQAGYAWIQRGVNKCGIESDPSIFYVTVS